MKKTLLLAFGIFSGTLLAQVGIGTANVNPDALLELKSPSDVGGLLLDNVLLSAIESPAPFPNHIPGMLLYNSATNPSDPENIYPGLYYNDGTRWVRMAIDNEFPKLGEVKQSVLASDHDGWYKLDGRGLAFLPATAQQNAAAIGISANLPNTEDVTLKGKTFGEDFGDLGGQTSFVIEQENLPDITYEGTTSVTGAHAHSYVNRGSGLYNYTAGALGGLRFETGSTRSTGSAGAHTHILTVPSGGSDTPIEFRPKYMAVQMFIYLGY